MTIKYEDKQALIELVKEEIEEYNAGRIKEISGNETLAELVGCSYNSIINILKENKELSYQRAKILYLINGKKNNQKSLAKQTYKERLENYQKTIGKLTSKQMSKNGKKGYEEGIGRLTPAEQLEYWKRTIGKPTYKQRLEIYNQGIGKLTHEEKVKRGKKSYQEGLAKLTYKQRLEIWKKGIGNLTYEQMSENGKKAGKKGYQKGLAKLTYEERVEIGKKAGKKAFLAAQKAPNGVEGILMTALGDLYAQNTDNARNGQLYYPGISKNKWYRKLEDGKYKLPDFKIKGQKKVIEIYGEYHHSKEFCEKYGKLEDYHYIPERLIEEYAKVGIECRVYWSKEIKNPQRLSEIVNEIKDWVIKDAKTNSQSQPVSQGAAA